MGIERNSVLPRIKLVADQDPDEDPRDTIFQMFVDPFRSDQSRWCKVVFDPDYRSEETDSPQAIFITPIKNGIDLQEEYLEIGLKLAESNPEWFINTTRNFLERKDEIFKKYIASATKTEPTLIEDIITLIHNGYEEKSLELLREIRRKTIFRSPGIKDASSQTTKHRETELVDILASNSPTTIEQNAITVPALQPKQLVNAFLQMIGLPQNSIYEAAEAGQLFVNKIEVKKSDLKERMNDVSKPSDMFNLTGDPFEVKCFNRIITVTTLPKENS